MSPSDAELGGPSGNGSYAVEVGPSVFPSWSERLRSLVGAATMVVILGALAAATVGVILVLIAVIVSAAIN